MNLHSSSFKNHSRWLIILAALFFMVSFQMVHPALSADEMTTAPPRLHPLPKVPPHPSRPRVPHGPSGKIQPFMKKLQGYNKRLKENPEDIEALIFLANANFDIQRFEKASSFYLQVLKIDPGNLQVRTDLASVYRSLGKSEKAVETLKVVLSLNPNHEVALYNIGIILLNDQKDFDGAADAWERLVKINPNDPLAEALREKVAKIRKGELKPSQQDQPDKAQQRKSPRSHRSDY